MFLMNQKEGNLTKNSMLPPLKWRSRLKWSNNWHHAPQHRTVANFYKKVGKNMKFLKCYFEINNINAHL